MKTPAHLLLAVGVFSLCAVVAWLASRTPASSTATADAADAGKAAKTARVAAKSAMPSEVLAMLAPVRAAQDTEERLRATIQLATNIPMADIEKWLSATWFDGTEDMQSSLFTRTLLSRWQEEDPAAMLSFCLKKQIRITYEFAGEWARRDPAAALACIEEQADPTLRSSMLSYMGDALSKADPQLVASHIVSLSAAFDSQNQSYMVSNMIRNLAMSSPELLRAQAANWPAALQGAVRNSLAAASLKKSFASGLAELSSQEGGKAIFMSVVGNDDALMKEISRNPSALPEGWFGQLLSSGSAGYYLVREDPVKWLDMDLGELGLTAEQARNLRSNALNGLVSKDKEKLKALIAGGELDDNERTHAIRNLVMNMKQEDADAWIAGLNEEDQKIANATSSGRSQSSEKDVTPAGLLGDLAQADRKIGWNEARAVGKWGSEQMQVLNSQFDSLPADQKAVVAGKFLTNDHSELPAPFRAKALGYLLANPQPAPAEEAPAPRNGFSQRRGDPLASAACNIAVKWVADDSVAAAAWVKGLPTGEARKWASRNLVVQWAEYEPAAARQWIASMPAGERGDLEQALQNRNSSP
ncbi:hypothetical protein [Haloferula sp. BvORR071]|uniref:hypothetical protein n=1 Tax=Haloferula sp. BvORR071 TaxID=1396141 RepID=UPI000552EAED|nr:hypothetical protein [Haloferula sp. BvORR071]